jgi:hypothetical protein
MTPASAVSIAAAAGTTKAANGIRVGSLPVSNTGRVMPRIVAKVQHTRVPTDSPIQVGCHLALSRSRLIAHRKTNVPIPPQNQVVNAATGRCCCSEPETRSGARRLSRRTAVQIPPTPIAVHSIQERSAVASRRTSGETWPVGSGVVIIPRFSLVATRLHGGEPVVRGKWNANPAPRPPFSSDRIVGASPGTRLDTPTPGNRTTGRNRTCESG